MQLAILTTFSIMVILLFGLPHRAAAYLDPGSGSYLLQLLIAGLLGALFVIKTYWRTIKSFISAQWTKIRSSSRAPSSR